MENVFSELSSNFPFLTIGRYIETDYIGIVQNCDTQFISIYCYDAIPMEMRPKFLEFGEEWWWESNRQIPINMYLGDKFKIFRPYLKTFSKKNFEISYGPTTSLGDVIQKRIKRRQIQLLIKPR
jgi:hypothetical protein